MTEAPAALIRSKKVKPKLSRIAACFLAAFVTSCVSHPKKESPAAAPSESVAAVPTGFYIVQAGDTGVKIARKHNLMIADLAAMNPELAWAMLKVGQLVRIAK